MRREEMVYTKTLRTRYGLTPSLIRMLGKPDQLVDNPHRKSGPPAGLYRVRRVERFIARHREAVEAAKAQRLRRQGAASKALETKKKRLRAEVDAIGLRFVKPLPARYEVLLAKANSYATLRYGDEALPAGLEGVISTVRHEYTNYDELLARLSGRPGGKAEYHRVREEWDERIGDMLAQAYPENVIDPANPPEESER